jgi:sec-independent protein translocase protein TatA
MNVFGIGLPEMAVIAAIALLVFGPKRLPELGKTLGRTLKGFQSASQGFEEQFRTALDASSEPPSPPAAASSGEGAAATAETIDVAATSTTGSPSA